MSQLESSEPQPPVFQHKLGDKVLARWSDGKDYPGIVSSYFPDGAYNVIFYDGYRKKVKAKYIASLPEDYNETLVPPSSAPSVPVTETTVPLQVEGDKAPKMEVSIVPAVMTHPSKEFFIEEDHNHFKCPAENCTKAFRKEKALSGHLKHYHPELNSQSKRRNKPPVSKNNDLSNALKETSTKIQEVIAPPIEDKPAKKTNLIPSKDSHKSPSKSKKDKNDSHITPVIDKESNTCQKPSTKSSNIKGNDKTKNSSIKQLQQQQQDTPLKIDETPIPIKTNHEPLNNNLNVYKPLEVQISSEIATSNPPMTLFTPSPVKKEQNNQQIKKETQPKPSNNQQPQQLNQPPPTGKKRGRKRKSEIEANELARLKEESKTNKVRVVEKVSSVSPSMMFLDESNPIPNPVLPFSDPRTIREIHESDDVDELVNCICDLRKESGLMVQCECCLTWQHGSCLGIKADKDLPDVYVCFICKNPRGSREKCRYKYDWNWLRNGTLPLFPGFDSSKSNSNSNHKKNIVTTNQLLNDALEVLNIIHDLKHKIQLLDLKNGDLSLWNTSWVASKEAKIMPTREQEIVHNDFVGLKANENDMINDILDFSKNILETVTTDDKNDVPDDLENEIAEGTDLIDFIASSYSEMNGTKEEEETITGTPIPENQVLESKMMEASTLATNLGATLPETTLVTTPETQNQQTSTLETTILATSTSDTSTLETSISEMQTQETPILATSTLASSLTSTLTPTIGTSTSDTPMLEAPSLETPTLEASTLEASNLKTSNLEAPNLETANLQTSNLETPSLTSSSLGLPALELPPLEVPNLGLPTLELSNLKGSTFERLISGSEVVEEDQTTIRRQNLIKHILDVRERLEKKLDLIKAKVCELEKEYGLDPDPEAVEQDACAFRNAIQNLYADLEIVHQMSLCTTLN